MGIHIGEGILCERTAFVGEPLGLTAVDGCGIAAEGADASDRDHFHNQITFLSFVQLIIAWFWDFVNPLVIPDPIVNVEPFDLTGVHTGRVGVVTGGGLGFPALLLQLPHQLVSLVDGEVFGFVLAVDLGVQIAQVALMGGSVEGGDGEGDDVPLHFGFLPFLFVY